MTRSFRKTLWVGALIVLGFSTLTIRHSVAQPRKGPRVIVIGFDGVDAGFTEQWMNEGKLPNLSRLRESGTFRPLRPTTPPQTPVSWSTFATGIDPGRTGIFDFLRRDPRTYLPVFAAFEETTETFLLGKWNFAVIALTAWLIVGALVYAMVRLLKRPRRLALILALVPAVAAGAVSYWWASKNIPITRPGVINRREGIPMWDVVAKAGLKARVVHVPVTFPATDFAGGHMVSGLGVPDISGRVGKPFYFTSELDLQRTGSNEFSIDVVQLEDNRGVIDALIVGPPNKLFGKPPYISTPMRLTVPDDRRTLQIEVGKQKFSLAPRQWSGWIEFEFPFNSLIKVQGISRFYLLAITPEIKLYLSPINFDPRKLPPGLKITAPTGWAGELSKQFGPFKTMGWAIDTWAISEGFANEQIFWDDMEWTVKQYRAMYDDFLDSDDDLFIQCFEFPDRVGHVLYRLIDPQHPAYRADLAAVWGDGLLRSYQLMDQIVGDAMARAEKNGDVLIVMSDHGFATWRKSINYNTWLVQNGYMGVKAGVEAKARNVELLFDHGQFWENVDWSKTRAYALGLGDVYINLQGREAQGTVRPGEEYESLKRELQGKLEAIVDPENGEKPVSKVFLREELYRKFDPNVIPDLFVTNARGYRVSWQTSLGGIQKDLIEVNNHVWSGDHCSLNPELVKGIFFTNRKLTTDRAPYIADIYPTVLDHLGLTPPYELDGVALK